MIRFVAKYSYTQEHCQKRARGHYDIVVYYESKHRRFSDSDTLPMTVVDYMLNARLVDVERNRECIAEYYRA